MNGFVNVAIVAPWFTAKVRKQALLQKCVETQIRKCILSVGATGWCFKSADRVMVQVYNCKLG